MLVYVIFEFWYIFISFSAIGRIQPISGNKNLRNSCKKGVFCVVRVQSREDLIFRTGRKNFLWEAATSDAIAFSSNHYQETIFIWKYDFPSRNSCLGQLQYFEKLNIWYLVWKYLLYQTCFMLPIIMTFHTWTSLPICATPLTRKWPKY